MIIKKKNIVKYNFDDIEIKRRSSRIPESTGSIKQRIDQP